MASLSQGRTAAAQCGLFTYKSVPVIFEQPCIFKWFYTFNKKKMIYEECVPRMMMMMMMMIQKNSNSTFCDKYINNNNNKFMEQFRTRKICMFMIEY